MNVTKVAILGAGNGGLTAAADLSKRGFDVALYELPQFSSNLEVVKKRGTILLQEPTGESLNKIGLVTTDIEKAIQKCSGGYVNYTRFCSRSFC